MTNYMEELFKLLLSTEILDLDRMSDKCGRENKTILHYAIKKRSAEMVEFLIDHGADVNSLTEYSGLTPLHIASKQGSLEIVQLLIDEGATIDSKADDSTPLYFASEGGHLEIVRLLVLEDADVYAQGGRNNVAPIHIASRRGYLEIVKFFIGIGVDVNLKTTFGSSTPLWCASNGEHIETIKYLIDNGAEYRSRFISKKINTYIDNYKHIGSIDEWRPWNHNQYPSIYRQAVVTVAILAKTE